MTDRVVAYIDGFNLYFGLKADRGRKDLWLDLESLIERLLRSGQELRQVWYVSSAAQFDGAYSGGRCVHQDRVR